MAGASGRRVAKTDSGSLFPTLELGLRKNPLSS